jgi:uncharacterized protein YbbC (DUF1343 family)
VVVTGAQRVLDEPGVARRLAGGRYALVCHAASVDSSGRYLFDSLAGRAGLAPAMLLVPEHGLLGEQVYMEAVPDAVDPRLGMPVVSLYGDRAESLAPRPEVVRGLDAVVFDLQDVGSRYYTYLATMAMCMDVCAAEGVRFVVLDRPNPIGSATEGNTVREDLRSFVGWVRGLRNRHGLTAGDVARLHAKAERIDLDLDVVECAGLDRDALWPANGLPWIPPSPNMPTWETALVYPGMCLLEGTNLSEGRGTTTPFLVFGAPWVRDPWALASALDRLDVPGVAWRPTYFSPSIDKCAGRRCGGCQVVVTDVRAFRPLLAGLAVLHATRSLHPGDFSWRTDAYEFVHDRLAIDLLLGEPAIREALEAGDFHAAVALAACSL